jgi:hypothetical protein
MCLRGTPELVTSADPLPRLSTHLGAVAMAKGGWFTAQQRDAPTSPLVSNLLFLIHTGEILLFFFGERTFIEITLEDILMPQ